MSSPAELERVREELRRLGYLSHRLDRFLLQDGLRPRGGLGAWLRLAGKVGPTAGGGLALVASGGLALANGSLAAAPTDPAVLFLHLVVPLGLAAAALFLALAGALAAALRWLPVRRFEAVPTALAAAVAGALAGAGLWQSWGHLRSLPRPQVALALVAGLAAAAGLAALLDRALLALAIGMTRHAPAGRRLSPRRLALAALLLAVALALPLLLSARQVPATPVASLPMAPGDRVLLLAVDGVLPGELDYLLARGELPTLAELAAAGSGWRPYRRPAMVPATFWTGVATGVAPAAHGVVALDAVEPLGVSVPLARLGPTRAVWRFWSEPLGLAAVRPLLAGRRRAAALWELASRGGAPVLAVNWWATFPAEPLPGLVVAHGARQLLAEGAVGAVAPEERGPGLAALAADTSADPASLAALRALGEPERARIAGMALAPDALYRRVLADEVGGRPRVAALYLPGLDIAAEGWSGGDLAFADLLRAELAAADRLLADGGGFDTVAVIVDPGRRGAVGEGRAMLWRRAGCGGPARPAVEVWQVEAVTAALFRAAGLPQSAELPEPVAACRWPEPPARVPTYGGRPAGAPRPASDAEYLKSLRALGYL